MRRFLLPTTLSYLSVVFGVSFLFTIMIAIFPQWWLFDLFSHFRIQYVLAGFLFLPILLWLKKYLVASVVTLAIIIHSYAIWPYLQANVSPINVQAQAQTDQSLKVLFANIYYKSTDFDQVEKLINDNNPDVMIFAEVNQVNYLDLVSRIEDIYPYHEFKDGVGAYDISYFSKVQLTAEAKYFSATNPSWWLTYQKGDRKLRILGIHPQSPISQSTTRERNAHLTKALNFMSETNDPAIVIGDFNISQFSQTFQNLIEENNLIDTQIEFGLQPSWHSQMPSLFRIPIDQVLVNNQVEVIDRYVSDLKGSDHFPIVVVVDW